MKFETVRAAIEADKKYKTGRIREQNYEVILNAAEQIFAEKGFQGASMLAIANEAGLPKANVHYYFKNKATLYSAVLERIINVWNQGLENITPEDDPAEVLSAYIFEKTYLAFVSPLPSRLFAQEIVSGGEYLSDYLQNQMQEWLAPRVKVFEAWIEQGKMQNVDAERLLCMIWSGTQYYADFERQISQLRNNGNYSQEDIAQTAKFVANMLIRACGIKLESQMMVSDMADRAFATQFMQKPAASEVLAMGSLASLASEMELS